MIRIRFYGLEAGVASSQTFVQVTPRTRGVLAQKRRRCNLKKSTLYISLPAWLIDSTHPKMW